MTFDESFALRSFRKDDKFGSFNQKKNDTFKLTKEESFAIKNGIDNGSFRFKKDEDVNGSFVFTKKTLRKKL